jgi:hypothetical protein
MRVPTPSVPLLRVIAPALNDAFAQDAWVGQQAATEVLELAVAWVDASRELVSLRPEDVSQGNVPTVPQGFHGNLW